MANIDTNTRTFVQNKDYGFCYICGACYGGRTKCSQCGRCEICCKNSLKPDNFTSIPWQRITYKWGPSQNTNDQ